MEDFLNFYARHWDYLKKYKHTIHLGKMTNEIKKRKAKYDALEALSGLGS